MLRPLKPGSMGVGARQNRFGMWGARSDQKQDALNDLAGPALMHMAVPMFILDDSGVVVAWNEACARLTGLAALEVMGTRNHWKGFYKAERPCLADLALKPELAAQTGLYAAQNSADAKQGLKAENWCDLPRGARRYLSLHAFRMTDASGRVLGVVETLHDLTSEKEAQQAVEYSSQEQTGQLDQIREALGEALRRLARGDLLSRVDEVLPGSTDALRTDFNAAVGDLHGVVTGVLGVVERLQRAVANISGATTDLSRRTDQQAENIQASAVALGQITTTVQRTADGVAQARKVVSQAHGEAQRSGEVVRDAVAAMNEIQSSSQQIGQIIGVIDEIAFQTNLLALNAGVEAARAGEAGRGFAVVAQEVRALAQRSAEAAREIKSLISTSGAQVEKGVQTVAETGATLERILRQVAEISQIVSTIAASAQEQSSGLGQVNVTMGEMDRATHQNAAMARETSNVCRGLSDETNQLVEYMERFEVGQTQRIGRTARSAA